jgi:hypothetical protein
MDLDNKRRFHERKAAVQEQGSDCHFAGSALRTVHCTALYQANVQKLK